MSDVVFILGAGASCHCGTPLMGNFLQKAEHLYTLGQVGDREADFKRVFDARNKLQIVHSKSQLDLTNIETMFTAFEMAETLQKFPGYTQEDIEAAIASLKEVIVTTLEQTTWFSYYDKFSPSLDYRHFVNLVKGIQDQFKPSRSVSIITFNYDIAVDFALQFEGLGPSYCLDTKVPPEADVRLLKLHGSINWVPNEDGDTVIPLHLKDYLEKFPVAKDPNGASMAQMPIRSHIGEYFRDHTGEKIKDEPVIVPPTWNKASYQNAIRNVWRQAAVELGEAECIFVIGYSLPETDTFFRHLYALGTVGEKPLRKVCVYDIDKTGSVEARFKSMLGLGALKQYEYVSVRFCDAIGVIPRAFD